MSIRNTELKTVNLKELLVRIQYKEISKIVNDIGDRFPYAIIKGIPLSLMSYNDFFMRKIGDVDFLIDKKNIMEFDGILKKNGFDCEYSNREDKLIAMLYSHQTRPYVKNTPISKTFIDVNYDIFWGEYTGKRINIEEFLSNSIVVNIFGMEIRTLSPLKMLVAVILHHYKETNSLYHLATHNSIRQEMFCDVYNLVKNNISIISVDAVVDICMRYEITSYAYYILLYTYQLYPDEDILKYVDALRNEEGEKLLPCYGLDAKERKEWTCDFHTRIDETDLFALIQTQLSEEDIKKIERSKLIFGE